jgi:hypothetical protein
MITGNFGEPDLILLAELERLREFRRRAEALSKNWLILGAQLRAILAETAPPKGT